MSDDEPAAAALTGSPEVLDIESLLQPISEDGAVGVDAREDDGINAAYYEIKDARNGARAAERSAQFDGEDPWAASRSFWMSVLKAGPELLKTSTKDLEIAAYVVEALVRAHGFPGLRDGIRLLTGLVERFGDDVWPEPDEDGLETRVAPLTGLNGEGAEGTLAAPILNVTLTQGSMEGPFSAWQYQQALDLDRVTDEYEKERRIGNGAISMSQFETAVRETVPSFFRALRDDLVGAQSAWDAYSQAVDAKWGYDGPATSNVRQSLTGYLDTFNFVTRDILAPDEDEASSDEDADAGEGGGGASVGGAAKTSGGGGLGEINSRDDALRVLSKVADYYRRAEPHSPLSYALQRLVRWGRMPLPDLLSELISDQTARDDMFRLTGMEPPTEE